MYVIVKMIPNEHGVDMPVIILNGFHEILEFNKTTNSLTPISIGIPNPSVIVFDFSSIVLYLILFIIQI